MVAAARDNTPERILIVMPTWVGDVVMATPVLRALRGHYARAHISTLCSELTAPLLADCPWLDQALPLGRGRDGGVWRLARTLRGERFDMAVVLPNSFRAALLAYLARIPRRVGYDRDGRGMLLTDRLMPLRDTRRFIPVPTVEYYLSIARYLGAAGDDATLQLFTSEADDQRVADLLRDAGVDVRAGARLLLLTPGANYGDAKLWPAERFAAVADQGARTLGLTPAVSGAPGERPILDAVCEAATTPVVDLPALGVDLKLLKSVLRYTAATLTNDTGPRHMAAAMGVPVVTVFGPTDPAWTELDFQHERQLVAGVFCQPCQLKRCPIDHRCMTAVSVDDVFEQVRHVLQEVA